MCPKGDFFLQAIDTKKDKVATFIIDIICQVVEKMGSEHIAHVVNTNLAM